MEIRINPWTPEEVWWSEKTDLLAEKSTRCLPPVKEASVSSKYTNWEKSP
jgi:hypothetical protein